MAGGGLRGASSRGGLRGIGPALAGNVGASWAFSRPRDGNQDVDVPRLAPARSRCHFVDWGYVPLRGGLSVANEEKQSSLTRSAGAGAWGLWAVGAPRDRSCARRERWGQLGFRAVARGGSGCRRSYARSGPVPLPLRGLGVCPSKGWFECRQRGKTIVVDAVCWGDGAGDVEAVGALRC
jgi:hypothetical protein